MTYRLPFVLGLAHGVSDASAGLLVAAIIQQHASNMNLQILQYNLLAFGLMPLAGIWFDRANMPRQGAAAGLLLTLGGLLSIQINLNLAVLLIGLGSAGLHAGGGSISITSTPGRAAAPGVFAAFGVAGLALGGAGFIFDPSGTRFVLAAALALLAALTWWLPSGAGQVPDRADQPMPMALPVIALLLAAVALRSTVWVGAQTGVVRYSAAAVWMASAAGVGKLAGGFASDRLGWQRFTAVGLTGAGLLLVFANQQLLLLMLGAMLLQSITPVSMAAAGRALPGAPALAASLALGTSVIAGGLPFFFLPGGWFTPAVLAVTLSISILAYWLTLGKIHPGDLLTGRSG